MTKLEWCRDNAPNSIKELSDAEVLEYMSSAYEKFCEDEKIVVEERTADLNDINEQMDIMVTVLTRAFGDKITFKGGYMLTKLMPKYARQTTDIDFSIQSSELYKDLLVVMDRIGKSFVEKGFIAKYTIKPEVKQRMSGGMDMYDANGGKVLGIDIGWHDVTFGTTLTNINVGTVKAFTVERMLADKITAILSRKRFRRPKDIYDLYCITNCFDFDANLVNEYILRRTDGAGADWNNFPFSPEVLREYEKAYDKLSVQSIVKDNVIHKPDFDAIMERFNVICLGIQTADNKHLWKHIEGYFAE